MMAQLRERRVRVYWLSEQDALELVRARWRLPSALCLAFFEGVPDDCIVESVHADWQRRAFGFTLSHPSFEKVPEGEYAPSFGEMKYEMVNVEMRYEKGITTADAYAALLRENAQLRGILGDALEDDERLKAAYERGHAEGSREGYREGYDECERVYKGES